MATKRKNCNRPGRKCAGQHPSGTDGGCKITAKAIVDLIEEGCEVVVAHGNGPRSA